MKEDPFLGFRIPKYHISDEMHIISQQHNDELGLISISELSELSQAHPATHFLLVTKTIYNPQISTKLWYRQRLNLIISLQKCHEFKNLCLL